MYSARRVFRLLVLLIEKDDGDDDDDDDNRYFFSTSERRERKREVAESDDGQRNERERESERGEKNKVARESLVYEMMKMEPTNNCPFEQRTNDLITKRPFFFLLCVGCAFPRRQWPGYVFNILLGTSIQCFLLHV
jgi:hypothetical protein